MAVSLKQLLKGETGHWVCPEFHQHLYVSSISAFSNWQNTDNPNWKYVNRTFNKVIILNYNPHPVSVKVIVPQEPLLSDTLEIPARATHDWQMSGSEEDQNPVSWIEIVCQYPIYPIGRIYWHATKGGTIGLQIPVGQLIFYPVY